MFKCVCIQQIRRDLLAPAGDQDVVPALPQYFYRAAEKMHVRGMAYIDQNAHKHTPIDGDIQIASMGLLVTFDMSG